MNTSSLEYRRMACPGCQGLEHTNVVTQVLREARKNKGDLMVLWLDLANAYGSMPHKLVLEALERQHVPAAVRDLILDYYSNFSLRVSARSTTSEWHRLEVRIITGCTTSVILFTLAMNKIFIIVPDGQFVVQQIRQMGQQSQDPWS